jgi:YfiH family protein
MEVTPLPLIGPHLAWTGVNLFCTTRSGGAGQSLDDTFNLGLGTGAIPEVVLSNRALLRQNLPSEPVWLKQVHGCRVVDADVHDQHQGVTLPPEADASVTAVPGRVLAILTADCLPIVMADQHGTVLGVAHAGWRGLAGGVLEACLSAMRQKAPHAQRWRAWIGPGIGPQVFQVGQDVRQAFEGSGADCVGLFKPDPAASGKWLADLPGLARWRLHALGVQDIEACGLCTMTDPDHRFFSYRRDPQTGRMATIAWLDGASA